MNQSSDEPRRKHSGLQVRVNELHHMTADVTVPQRTSRKVSQPWNLFFDIKVWLSPGTTCTLGEYLTVRSLWNSKPTFSKILESTPQINRKYIPSHFVLTVTTDN